MCFWFGILSLLQFVWPFGFDRLKVYQCRQASGLYGLEFCNLQVYAGEGFMFDVGLGLRAWRFSGLISAVLVFDRLQAES